MKSKLLLLLYHKIGVPPAQEGQKKRKKQKGEGERQEQ
jgi:hypothetical protein